MGDKCLRNCSIRIRRYRGVPSTAQPEAGLGRGAIQATTTLIFDLIILYSTRSLAQIGFSVTPNPAARTDLESLAAISHGMIWIACCRRG